MLRTYDVSGRNGTSQSIVGPLGESKSLSLSFPYSLLPSHLLSLNMANTATNSSLLACTWSLQSVHVCCILFSLSHTHTHTHTLTHTPSSQQSLLSHSLQTCLQPSLSYGVEQVSSTADSFRIVSILPRGIYMYNTCVCVRW